MSTTLNAYLTEYCGLNNKDLHALPHEELARGLWVTPHDYTDDKHILVGHAEVTITLMPRVEVVTQQVEALRKQIEETRMEAGVKVLQLERQINSLLCIEGAANEVTS